MATIQASVPKGRGFLYLAHMDMDTVTVIVTVIDTNTNTDTDKTVDLLRGEAFFGEFRV